jgi:hypothetical protein
MFMRAGSAWTQWGISTWAAVVEEATGGTDATFLTVSYDTFADVSSAAWQRGARCLIELW